MDEKYCGLNPFLDTKSTCSWKFSSRRSARSKKEIPIGWLKSTMMSIRILLFLAGYICWLVASIVFEINAYSPHLATVLQSTTGWLLILVGVLCFFFSLYGASAKYMPKILVYLGRISYGLYVCHITMFWIVFQVFKNQLPALCEKVGLYEWKTEIGILLAFTAAVIFATLSYNFFEKPFLKLKKRFTLIPSRD